MSGDLPTGWAVASLGDLFEVLDRHRVPVNEQERSARLARSPERFPYFGATGQVGEIDEFLFEGESVLLGEDGAPFLEPARRKAYLVSGRYWVNNHAHILRARSPHSNAYFCHQLNAIAYGPHVSGTTRLKLTQAAMVDIELRVPPPPEQQRIVSRIEELFSEIDEGERALARVGQLVERYRQSVLKAAVTGELTRAWRESTAATPWSRAEISAIGTVTTGNTPPTSDAGNYGPGLPFLKPTDLDQGYTVTEYRQTLTDQGVQFCRPLKAQAVLVTCIGATIGKLGLARMACATNQQINAVEVDNSRMRAKFLYWCLASPEGQRAIIGGASATTLPILNKSRFQAITVPVPGLVEQDLIVDLIEQHIGQAERSAAAAAAERRRLQALRQSILKAAFSGQLVPQDPRDEPASALLARLAAQAAAAPAAPRRRGQPA